MSFVTQHGMGAANLRKGSDRELRITVSPLTDPSLLAFCVLSSVLITQHTRAGMNLKTLGRYSNFFH